MYMYMAPYIYIDVIDRYAYIYICTLLVIYIYAYAYIYICVCAHIFTHIFTIWQLLLRGCDYITCTCVFATWRACKHIQMR